MKLVDKILLGLLAVVVILLGLCVISAAVQFPLDVPAQQALLSNLNDPLTAIIVAVAAVVLIAISVRLLVALFSRKKTPTSVLVRHSESGSSYMTVSALNGMVTRYVQANPMVRECKTSVTVVGEAVKILARVGAMPDALIPTLTEELQNNIKTYVETYSGVRVEAVEVVVETTEASSAPARVS